MSLKSGILLALAYIVPFMLLMPSQSTNSPGAALLWFVYPIASLIVMLGVVIVGHHFFDISLSWGLLLLIGSPILTLLFSPLFSLVWGFYIVPTALVFLVGLMEGD